MDHFKKNRLYFLFAASDPFPLFRVDLTILFGKEILKRGHRIDWLLQSQKTCWKPFETKWQGSRVWVAGNVSGRRIWARLAKHLYKWANQLKIFSLVLRNTYDFIQVKDSFSAALIALIAKRIRGIPLVYWQSYPFAEHFLEQARNGHSPWYNFLKGHLNKILLYRIILPKADYIFVQSEQMKNDIAAQGIDKEKMTAVPMGIDLAGLPAASAPSASLNLAKPALVYMGVFFKIRRLDFLIRVIARVKSQIPGATLYMIGAGREEGDEEFLHREIERLHMTDAVIFTGFLPLEQAFQYIREADVCLSPYYPSFILNSTSPTNLIEYMAMGKAVVTTDHPEQSLIIQESGGGICVPYDEYSFAEAIVSLLMDPDQCQQMGKMGRDYIITRRSYEIIANGVEKKYRDIVASSRIDKKNN